MSKVIPVKFLYPDGTETVRDLVAGYATEPNAPCFLDYVDPQQGPLHLSGQDFFSCLRDLRLVLERQGIKVLCNGARIDAWVSGLASQMSAGGAVYLVKVGQPASPNDVVPLFGPTPAEFVGTVAEQRAYQEQWWASLG
jgi:hypothetical protein